VTVDELLAEYDRARAHTTRIIADLDNDALVWRPHENFSAIAWHLGHTAAVNHYLVRNLTSAEPSINPAFDAVFDSAQIEPARGKLPSRDDIVDYREQIAGRTHEIVGRIAAGEVGAPAQLDLIARTMITALVNHEYQHDQWIEEVRAVLGGAPVAGPMSDGLVSVDGYWVVRPD